MSDVPRGFLLTYVTNLPTLQSRSNPETVQHSLRNLGAEVTSVKPRKARPTVAVEAGRPVAKETRTTKRTPAAKAAPPSTARSAGTTRTKASRATPRVAKKTGKARGQARGQARVRPTAKA